MGEDQRGERWCLSLDAISEMGFGNPANVRVYGYGGHLQKELIDADTDFDDLEEVSLWPVADGYLFYANGLETFRDGRHIPNHYARAACYFVTEAASPVPAFPSTSSSATPAGTLTTFDAYVSYHPQTYAWFHGGRQLFEDYDYASGNSRNYTLTLPCRSSGAQGRLTVGFSASEASATQVTTRFNNNALGMIGLVERLEQSAERGSVEARAHATASLHEKSRCAFATARVRSCLLTIQHTCIISDLASKSNS